LRLAIITHALDRRRRTGFFGLLQRSRPFYQIDVILKAGREAGLRWFYTDPGQPFRPADAAFLHVDMSLIPQDYLDLAMRYPRVINGKVSDIRKRHVSRNLLEPASDWAGPVLVKSDLNIGGKPEAFLARKAAVKAGLTPPTDEAADYQWFEALSQVPDAVWQDPTQVVERYLPEQRGTDNVLRVWSFLGGYERCNWYSAPEIFIKARHISAFGPSEVPDEIRAERRRLGFDYGKFDFAIGPEGPVLYDANRTPGYLFSRPEFMAGEAPLMFRALEQLVQGQSGSRST